MAISYINTEEVKNIAKDIVSLANDLDYEFNNLFKRFSDVPTVTKEWVGNQANYYFNHIEKDKKQYMDFSNEIRNIGKKIDEDVNQIQSSINMNNSDEFVRRD